MPDADVLIVGAGPAGLFLACDLLRRGVRARLIDKLPGPVIASKGKGVQPRTLEAFEDLGIIDEALANARLYPPIRLYKSAEFVRDHELSPYVAPDDETPYPNVMLQGQWKTEELLRAKFESLGGVVEYGSTLLTLEQRPDAIEAVLEANGKPERLTLRYLVGSDGGRGATRKLLDIPFVGATPVIDGILVGDVRVDGLDRDYWHSWTGPTGRRATLCPLPATDAYQFTAMIGPEEEPELTLETAQAILDSAMDGHRLTLRDMTWISLFRPNVRMAASFRKGRGFLVGDAAHVHTPAGAQGLNTSIQDSYNLGWKLGRALQSGDDAVLDTYDEERRPVAASVLQRSDALYKDALGKRTSIRGDDERQLKLTYRGSSLCGPENAETKLQPGDRMPDIPLTSPAGEATRLFKLLAGPQGATLAFDRPAPASTNDRAVSIGRAPASGCDYVGRGAVAADLAGRIVSVRPDGYIAAISAASRTASEGLETTTGAPR